MLNEIDCWMSLCQVLDIGANIGYYTLLAARLGHRVVAVEPMLDSIQRLHRAAQIDHTADNIQIVHNAVAEIRTRATLRPNGDNQGDARIQLWVTVDCISVCNNEVLVDQHSYFNYRRYTDVGSWVQHYEKRSANCGFKGIVICSFFSCCCYCCVCVCYS